MTDQDPLRKAARVARRIPGYRYVRRVAVPRLRQSPVARALAQRIFAAGPPSKRSSWTPSDITAGNLLGGIGVERLPVVVLVLIGTPSDRVGAIAAEVARQQVLGAAFRPVFVLDSPTFSPIRKFGYVVELVTPHDSWTADEPWSEYLRRRLASMMALYRARAVIRVGAEGLDDGTRAVLGAFG